MTAPRVVDQLEDSGRMRGKETYDDRQGQERCGPANDGMYGVPLRYRRRLRRQRHRRRDAEDDLCQKKPGSGGG